MENQLDGLPEHGVLLAGSPENPIIENHSGRTVIAYVLRPGNHMLLAFSAQPAGIPDGGSLYAKGAIPVNPPGPMQRPVFQTTSLSTPNRNVADVSPGQGPIVRATLQNVAFADGQFVGVAEYGVVEYFGRKIKVIREVGLLAKAEAWGQVEALAPIRPRLLAPPPSWEDPITYFDRRAAALRLTLERKRNGDAAANKLAEIYSSLPTLWM